MVPVFNKTKLPNELATEMVDEGVWKPGCPVTLDRLMLVNLSFYDFEGKVHYDGQIIVFDVVADDVIEIFEKLYKIKFPINKVKSITEYCGNDEKSMDDNNSSCFNYRQITSGGSLSIHSYGLAIDINPIQNPYIDNITHKIAGRVTVQPAKGIDYLNRTNIRSGMCESQLIINIFKEHGFKIWGGQWNNPIDWQHFQVDRFVAEQLAKLNYEDGIKYFLSYKKNQ